MPSERQLFLKHLGQTSDGPLMLEVEKASGIFIYDKKGKSYYDLISGVSVSNVGHQHPFVVTSIKNQVDKYMHLMVYGEFIQSPQTNYAKALIDLLPDKLESVYFVNSGSEAVEGALKLAKRVTKRSEILAFNKAYHGSTHGALSVLGGEYYKNAFRPLLPEVSFLEFNSQQEIDKITKSTACVLVEPVQAEAGVINPQNDFLKKLRKRCDQTGALLIFDEVQTGLGRTGKMFAFEHFDVVPDILVLAKSLGGGMPLGAFISSKKNLDQFTHNPVLGHITTFGGHPVSCAAGYASLQVIQNENLLTQVNEKSNLFKRNIKHSDIIEIRNCGLLMAVEFNNRNKIQRIMRKSLDEGIILDYFLFNDTSFRISPPLNISIREIENVCRKLNYIINET